MENNIGEKIRKFRQGQSLSQMDLEMEIGASTGSISRIENNLVKPTKETLSKIAKALKLKPSEVADLLGLKIFSPEELIIAINTLSKCLDLETTLQTAVDIMFDLYPNYNGGVVLLVDETKQYVGSKTVSKMPRVEVVHRLLPKNILEYYIPIENKHGNLIAKSVKNRANYQSFDIADFSKGEIDDNITRTIGRVLGFKCGIAIPMIFEDEVIGATLYTKSVKEEFTEEEKKILMLLNDQLAISIRKAQLFEEIQSQMKSITDKIRRSFSI